MNVLSCAIPAEEPPAALRFSASHSCAGAWPEYASPNMKSVAASLITEYLKEISDIKALAGQVIVTGRSAILFIASGSEKSIFIVAESGWLQWENCFPCFKHPV
jgi:hypothetical protein